MMARLGLRLAMSRSPEHRWRQVALPAAVAGSLLAVLLWPCLVRMAGRQQARIEDRVRPCSGRLTAPETF